MGTIPGDNSPLHQELILARWGLSGRVSVNFLPTTLDLVSPNDAPIPREFISPCRPTSSVRRRKTMNANGVADLDRHQVFTKLNGTCVVLPYKTKCKSRR